MSRDDRPALTEVEVTPAMVVLVRSGWVDEDDPSDGPLRFVLRRLLQAR